MDRNQMLGSNRVGHRYINRNKVSSSNYCYLVALASGMDIMTEGKHLRTDMGYGVCWPEREKEDGSMLDGVFYERAGRSHINYWPDDATYPIKYRPDMDLNVAVWTAAKCLESVFLSYNVGYWEAAVDRKTVGIDKCRVKYLDPSPAEAVCSAILQLKYLEEPRFSSHNVFGTLLKD